MYLTCVFSCKKKVTDSNVCLPGHSVLISYSASGAKLIRLTALRDKPKNLRNDMTIRIDSTKPLVLNMPQDEIYCHNSTLAVWLFALVLKDKGKGRVRHRSDHVGPQGDYRYSPTLLLTSALDGVGGQRHAPAALPPGMTRYLLYRRLRGPQGRSGRVREMSPPLGFDPRTVQPVASRYTY